MSYTSEGLILTSQGAMTAAGIEEWRRDTDWYELHPRVPEKGECQHGRRWTDDCDDCDLDDVRALVGKLAEILDEIETRVYQVINGAPACDLPGDIAPLLAAFRCAEAGIEVAP